MRSSIKDYLIFIFQLSTHTKRRETSYLCELINHVQMIFVFNSLFLESGAQELGSIGVTVIVITYYENQQQILPSYMTLLAWFVNGMCVTF